MSGEILSFKTSEPLTLGVELELQIVNTRDYNLARGAADLLRLAAARPFPGDIKPEITESMIEVSTSVHSRYPSLLAELRSMRDALAGLADRLNLGIAGGGTHPFQKWSEQRIYPGERFGHLSDLYGYLAKQFTVFGQHIHVGCGSGDEAIGMVHRLARYIPHFIALSAASPFFQGTDTQFASSRLNAINAFPLSGYMPFVASWGEFNTYFGRMRGFGIVASMKDFYWDIRPKPEFGTIEIRVCDTPLTVDRAAALAAYAQCLAALLRSTPQAEPSRDIYLVYNYNRFQACRFGLDGELVDPVSGGRIGIRDDVLRTLERLGSQASQLEAQEGLRLLEEIAAARRSDSVWLRGAMRTSGSLHDVVRMQTERWREDG
ncbi:MAG TPA: YbdK family carboxylate-amine ligase [Burkholderiales bacterium]|nr:YbdK family carboxylate-amine ligase [Burkholderiales bacterium]